MNPAALSAAMRGDFENALIASTPGGIAAQEAAGQAELVANGARLPKIINRGALTREQVTAATGIVFGADADDLFVCVTLPTGWKLKATGHSMHSDLLDENGVKRAGVFYKAAFYDRNADMSFDCRYVAHNDYEDPISHITVRDGKTGAVLFTAPETAYRDFKASDASYETAQEWLAEHFPEHRDPLAYWAD
jgi:hypothetical protein